MTDPIKLNSPPWKQELRAAYACGACNGDGDSGECNECDGTGISWQPVDLEDLTAEAVRAERERIIEWLDYQEKSASSLEFKAAAWLLREFLEPDPLTPKEVLGHILEDDDQAEEVLAALACYAESIDLVNQTFVRLKDGAS